MREESPLKESVQATETVRTVQLICAVPLLKRYEITVLGVVKARKSGITDFSRDLTRCLDAPLNSWILFAVVSSRSKI
jgi:hypothetical protein